MEVTFKSNDAQLWVRGWVYAEQTCISQTVVYSTYIAMRSYVFDLQKYES